MTSVERVATADEAREGEQTFRIAERLDRGEAIHEA